MWELKIDGKIIGRGSLAFLLSLAKIKGKNFVIKRIAFDKNNSPIFKK